jgi:hypothetical protein
MQWTFAFSRAERREVSLLNSAPKGIELIRQKGRSMSRYLGR